MELDHIYICTGRKAPEGDCLVQFGLQEGSSNVHPGQGTANRRFFFHNFMLELLWIADAQELAALEGSPIRLKERFDALPQGGSPFGLIFRPALPAHAKDNAPLPEHALYRPVYLPAPLGMQVATDNGAQEPNYVYLDFITRRDNSATGEPLDHAHGLKEVTMARVTAATSAPLSRTAGHVASEEKVEIVPGAGHLLELYFDGATQGISRDFRPHLPLIFHW
ncbi:VOC family protein [Desulfovibrio subterraneus]|uniref:hypothetical protein n=1 Tax=Desulfovibrio subterraneus TaxID=2718620 RepID=UPI0022B928A1|nr:hypothetical protein [Desulfovibrio subterraneus]WBF67358.1 VOC family protein [Desulfovibrio subterraneus]